MTSPNNYSTHMRAMLKVAIISYLLGCQSSTLKILLQKRAQGLGCIVVHSVRWLPCRASCVNLKQCKQTALRQQHSVVSPSLHRAMKVCKQSIWRSNRLEFHCMDSLVAVLKVLLTYGWPAYRTDSPVDKTPHT